jgi:hypothetical protein
VITTLLLAACTSPAPATQRPATQAPTTGQASPSLPTGAASPTGTIPSTAPTATLVPSSPDPSIAAESPSPAPTLDLAALEGKILFTRAGGVFGDETIFTANADGTDEQQITDFGETCCPRWSPDGAHILSAAMADDGRFTTQLIEPDGSLVEKIPLPPGTLGLGCNVWSAATDGLACEAFDEADPSNAGIYTIRASDWGDLGRVTESPGHRPFDFSVDGSQIYFFDGEALALFAVNVDGSGQQRITPEDLTVEAIDVGYQGGRRSPDGSSIVFGDEAGVLWTVHPDGSGLTKLFEDREGRLAATPTWSPDGAHIMFVLDPPGTDANIDDPPLNTLYVVNADGSSPTPVIDSDDWKLKPDWAR